MGGLLLPHTPSAAVQRNSTSCQNKYIQMPTRVIFVWQSLKVTIASMTKFHTPVYVFRDKKWIEIDSTELVPGDKVRVKSNEIAPCDMALICGSAVCDESGLTGEAGQVNRRAWRCCLRSWKMRRRRRGRQPCEEAKCRDEELTC